MAKPVEIAEGKNLMHPAKSMKSDIAAIEIYIKAKIIYIQTLITDIPTMGSYIKTKAIYIQTIDADIETIDIYI